MIWQTTFQSEQDCVSWQGHCAQEGNEFNTFLQGQVIMDNEQR